MTIEASIQSVLDADSGLAASVGERVAFGSRLQGEELPAVAFEVDGEEGLILSQSLRGCEVVVYSVATTAVSALAVADLVRTAMASLSGTVGSVTVSATIYLGRDVLPLETGEGDEAQPAVVESRFRVVYS